MIENEGWGPDSPTRPQAIVRRGPSPTKTPNKKNMLHLDLFSGIGGFALAAERVWPDVEHVFCEIDPFCRAILKKHWPNSYIYEDIRTLTNAESEQAQPTKQGGFHTKPCIQDTRVSLITGGFPCQPFSAAGKRKGTNDERHLWPEMRRVIQEFFPHYVVAENVRGLLSIEGGMVFETVCTDLEALGYEVQPFVIPACAVNAPHRRDRVWIVAHLPSRGKRCCECKRGDGGQPQATAGNRDHFVADAKHESEGDAEQGWPDQGASARVAGSDSWDRDWREVAFATCNDGMDDGLPEGVVRPRGWRNAALKAYGNAIVPQVAERIFRAIAASM